LREERGRFTLFCVDTALLPLLHAGIVPDYVINLDAQVLNLEDFYGVPDLLAEMVSASGLTLVADMSCDPRSFAAVAVPFALTATRFAPMRLWQRFSALHEQIAQIRQVEIGPLPLDPLGSVGVTSLAVALQCQPKFLLLVGYDFAYPADLHHVRGTSIHQKMLHTSNRLEPLNSVADTLRRSALNDGKGPHQNGGRNAGVSLAEGFSTDPILMGYARQLENYLHRYCRAELTARLEGPLELSGVAKLGYEQASAALKWYGPAVSKDWENGENRESSQVEACQAAIRRFWEDELEILQRIEAYIQAGNLGEAALWWRGEGYAADYLLRLCLPKAGYCEVQRCDWPKLLYLCRDFMALLRALLYGK
ncbi:MAG: 6-hydroxymethylpterin diphosphokinase MptE-like protein, partial [Spirochaetota bacterium]